VLPPWLSEQGVTVVIAGGMGSRAQGLFSQNRIKVVVGAVGVDPKKVVLDYMQGSLSVGDNVCDH
jgi:predicted Fe-Mo cluster-binding NifX family protein